MAYASGKYAQFVCDTCGWAYPYTTAKMTWEGNRVCIECYEPKQPQLDPPSAVIDLTGSNSMTFTDDPIGSKFEGEEGTGAVGDLTVSTG